MPDRGRGRPQTLAGQMDDLICEIEALTAESMRNEVARARLTRQLAMLHAQRQGSMAGVA